jgi:hypothetical protein
MTATGVQVRAQSHATGGTTPQTTHLIHILAPALHPPLPLAVPLIILSLTAQQMRKKARVRPSAMLSWVMPTLRLSLVVNLDQIIMVIPKSYNQFKV